MGENELYDADYFLRGQASGKSLYSDYRFIPELTRPMAAAMIRHMGARIGDTVLDFGCARGYLVRVLREMHLTAWGYDESKWAIDNCDPEVTPFVTRHWPMIPFSTDWVIAKDVLEHIPENELSITIERLLRIARRGVFIVVPLGKQNGIVREYIVPEYEKDITHLIRKTYDEWFELCESLCGSGWKVSATTRVKGIKDNYYDPYPTGNMFITILHQ